MSEQVQVSIDRKIYDRLLELEAPPYSNINAVLDRLLYHSGHASREATALEREEHHYTMEEERERSSAGVYEGSGIST